MISSWVTVVGSSDSLVGTKGSITGPTSRWTCHLNPAQQDLGRLAPLAEDAPALLLGRTAPDAVPLPVRQCELEARLAHGADAAHGLGRLCFVVGGRIEDVGLDTPAGGKLPPRLIGQGDHFLTTTELHSR